MRSQLYAQPKGVDRAPGLIVITPERSKEHEIESLEMLYKRGLYRLHIRKPNMDIGDLCDYTKRVAEVVDPKIISIHYSREIALELSLGGLHARAEDFQEEDPFIKSSSCHTLSEVEIAESIDYTFLSPIFNSISKGGYCAKFDIDHLMLPPQRRVVALGGVDGSNIESIARCGFFSAALLGEIWNRESEGIAKRFSHITRLWREATTGNAKR